MSEYNWYDRSRKYSYGDYKVVDGIGLYYNEDSNKWVNRLTKRVIEEKYIRYEFSIYNDKEIERDFGWSKIDRVGKFLFVLYKSGLEIERLKGERFVFLDSRDFVYGILGSDYKEIIRELDEELNIIDLRFGKGKFGKVKVDYKLNDLFFEKDCFRRVVFIRNSRVIRFLDRYYKKNVISNKYLEYEIKVCSRLSLHYNEVGLKSLLEKRLNRVMLNELDEVEWDFISNKERKNKSRDWNKERRLEYIRKGILSFELLRIDLDTLKYGGLNFKGFSSDQKFSGRLSNVINNKEKEFRKLLKLDNENLIDADMVNGYVSLLYRVFRGLRDLNRGESNFNDKLLDVLGDSNANDFLNKYECCFSGSVENRVDFYDYVGIELGNIEVLVGDDKRSYIKQLVLYLINGEPNDGRRKSYLNGMYDYDSLMEKIFGVGGFDVISKIKSSVFDFKFGDANYGYNTFKNMSKILMYMEVVIMKRIWDKLIDKHIPYISLYDGMLIKKSDRVIVESIVSSNLVGIDDCIMLKYR